MNRLPFSLRPFTGVLLAVAVVGVSSLILIILRPYLSNSVVALLYLVPVVISAALFGRLAGITASVLSFLVFNFSLSRRITPLWLRTRRISCRCSSCWGWRY